MLCFIYCGYAWLICRVLAPLHSTAFTLLQVKRHTVSTIDHPGSPTDNTHILHLHREYNYTISALYTLCRYKISPANRFSGRVAVTAQKPYSPVSLHYMPHISTLQVVYDVIFLVIMSSSLCRCSGMAAMAGSISGASCAWYSMPIPQCFFKHPVSFTAPPFICFGAAMQGHMVRTAMIRTSHYSCTHHLPRCPWWILTS